MNVQYLQFENKKFAVLDLDLAEDLLDYLEDLEDSLEALQRTQNKNQKIVSAEKVRKKFFQNKIHSLRIQKKLTQQELAHRLKATQKVGIEELI